MKLDNIIVAALFQGPSKPSMNALLKPILSDIDELMHAGVRVNASGSERIVN